MKRYSVSQVSKELNIPKDTLRYYDKLSLVSPVRGENHYRYYAEENLMDLMYIQVMKYAGFSLSEIRRVVGNRCNKSENLTCRDDTINLLKDKKAETLNKIQHLNKIIKLINITIDIVKNKVPDGVNDEKVANDLILNIYRDIHKEIL